MIIQVAGTNGAGKSTVVRAVMAHCSIVDELPDGYNVEVYGRVFRIPGRYAEEATGGCDIFKGVVDIHAQVRAGLAAWGCVLWEGGTSHGGLNQTVGPQLVEDLGVPYIVALLTTPYAVCLDGINARRADIGRPPLTDDQHIRSNYVRAQNYAARMRDAGAQVVRCSREEAPGRILELLRQS